MAMKTPPHRIAVIALVVLLLGCAAAIWWQTEDRVAGATSSARGPTMRPATVPPMPASRPGLGGDVQASAAPAIEACEQALRLQRAAQVEVLAKRQDADARIAVALLGGSPASRPIRGEQGPKAAMLGEATRAAPGDAELAWYHARYCASDPNCDATAANAHLLALEPDNLDGWLLALQSAHAQRDEAAITRALEGGARARYFDQRSGERFLRVKDALQGLPLPAACAGPEYARLLFGAAGPRRAVRAEDVAMLRAMEAEIVAMHSYTPLRTACAADHVARLGPRRGDACRGVAARLADGDQLIDRLFGEMTMVKLTAGDGQNAEWRERLRMTHWTWEQTRYLEPDFATNMRRFSDGEVNALREELAAAGKSRPPAGWLPDNARARSLILTGRAPAGAPR